MQAGIQTNEDHLVTEFIERMDGAEDGPAARDAYREGFKRLRSQLEMYPVSGRHASVIFESAAQTARSLAAACLPLGIGVAMHLYPLRVLKCMPLPLLSFADTSSVTFAGHRVPHGQYVLVADDEVLGCTSDYQRCWFHLFLAEMYLARLERLHHVWGLRRSAEELMSLNELSQLREYALRLLDDFSSGSDVQPLKRTTSAMKLRVSLMAQSTMTSLRDREDRTPADAQQLRADASELGYIKSQPTADEIILRSIGVLPQPSASI
jgi:hypothetical protein